MTAICTVIIFLLMVSVHEFGHFIVAKKSGMEVTEFAIGMGPAILKKEKGGTLYSIRILPLGGYCRITDELTEDASAFVHPVWKRFLMIIAGPVLNVVLGFVLILILVSISGGFMSTEIAELSKGAHMEEAGFKEGDKIIKINDSRIFFYEDITFAQNDFEKNKPIRITVKRGKEKISAEVMPTESITTYQYNNDGIKIINITGENREEDFIPYSDEVPRENFPVGTEEVSQRLIMGFVAAKEKPDPVNVMYQSVCYTGFVVKLVYKSFVMLVTGQVSMDNVSGPVGIVQQVNDAVHSGFRYILNLSALLTINLGVFNLLPVPALDGGRLVFIFIEFIRRKPVPPEKEGMVHAVGMILLLLFAAFISYKDVMKIITK
ncbi:MAG: RIP metalloprotease RseP [Oscillospiraceae bacterium]|nr:RIP metalloprotease RseP [Oscillospiraceae bacterium]